MEIQIERLREDGYLRLESVFSNVEIDRLRAILDGYIADSGQETGIGFEEVAGQTRVFAIDQLFNKGGNEFLALLNHPVISDLIEKSVGPDFFVSQEFVVIKNLGSPNEVGWHQDIVTKSGLKGYMIGIYLDDAGEQEGCLRIIPGSHHSTDGICDFIKRDHTTIPMEAGDVLIHDLELAHSSGLLTRQPIRRVVYIEVLPKLLVTRLGLYNPAFVAARDKLPELSRRPGTIDIKREVFDLYAVQGAMKPSNYCFP